MTVSTAIQGSRESKSVSNRLFATQVAELDLLARKGRARSLKRPAGLDFSSNDYLGLAGSARLAQAVLDAIDSGVSVGSGGSRLLRGHTTEHAALEEEAAAFFGAETALYLGSGFVANLALYSTLPRRGDIVVHDILIHASAHEGLRLSHADAVAAGHNDPQQVDDAIRTWRHSGGTGRAWIAVESLYSMDGDRAPIADLVAIADRHEAILVVDEAHATGIWGPGGRGLAAPFEGRENIIVLHTCGKALGTEGALVCGPDVVRSFLVQRARPFIFSTASSPLIAAATRESLRIIASEPERREVLMINKAAAERALANYGVAPTGSQILPFVLGEDWRAMEVAFRLQERGFDVRGIRPPTVPAGTARLRVSITCNVTPANIAELAVAFGDALA